MLKYVIPWVKLGMGVGYEVQGRNIFSDFFIQNVWAGASNISERLISSEI